MRFAAEITRGYRELNVRRPLRRRALSQSFHLSRCLNLQGHFSSDVLREVCWPWTQQAQLVAPNWRRIP
jgi:hypothetical protein